MRSLSVFLIAGLFVQAPATSGVIKVPISEERGLRDWELDGNGAWSVRGQSLILEKAGVLSGPIRRPAALAIFRDRVLTDFELQVDVRSTAPPDLAVRDVLLIFGYQSPTQFYYVHLAGTTDPVHNGIFLVNNADRRRLDDAIAPARLMDQAWHRIRLERQSARGPSTCSSETTGHHFCRQRIAPSDRVASELARLTRPESFGRSKCVNSQGGDAQPNKRLHPSAADANVSGRG